MIAYKGLKEDMSNYKCNFTYEIGKSYSALDVDMSDKDCSYGLNVCTTISKALNYGSRVFEVLIPDDCKIKFIGNNDKFRCETFTIIKEVYLEYEKYWNELTEDQKDLVCIYNKNFEYEKYWNELTEYQKNLVCINNKNFEYEKYWNELNEYQKDLVCSYNKNFEYEKYCNELTEYQKDLVCRNNKNFEYEKYWNKLTKDQKLILKQRVVKEV